MLSRSVVYDSLRPHRLQPARLLCPWGSHGVGGNAMCCSRGSSQPRDRTQVSCIVGGIFTVWAIFMYYFFALINICYLMMRYSFNYLASVWKYTESIRLNAPALLLHYWSILSTACTHSGNCQKESCQGTYPDLPAVSIPFQYYPILPDMTNLKLIQQAV